MTDDYRSDASTHPGAVRARNEDALLERPDIGLWAVADGAGGHGAGDVASAAVVDALADLPAGLSGAELMSQVRFRLAAVHAQLQDHAAGAGGGDRVCASTVIVAMIRHDHVACLWAGDSRAYVARGGALRQLTRDHSLVSGLVAAGLLTPEAARNHPQANVITRAVGAAGELELDKSLEKLQHDDVLLLCSDGLYQALDEAELARRLQVGDSARAIIQAAVAAGARDNVSALVIRPAEATRRNFLGSAPAPN